jgi:hypothetical protein
MQCLRTPNNRPERLKMLYFTAGLDAPIAGYSLRLATKKSGLGPLFFYSYRDACLPFRNGMKS